MKLRIREIMKDKNITSAFLSERVGISKVAISNIITGKSSPSLDNAIEIAKALGVSLSELVEKEEEPHNIITCPYCGRKIKIEKTDK